MMMVEYESIEGLKDDDV